MREFIALDEKYIDELVELEKLSFPTPWSKDAYIYAFSDASPCHYLGYLNEAGKLIAFGGFMAIADEAHITNVAVHPDYKRQGIGKELMVALISYAIPLGIEALTLEVRVSNIAAIGLYEAIGFKS